MPIGRPYNLTPNVASKTVAIIATEGQTSFSPTGGYMIGEIAVYRNGVKLVQDRDFTANDGASVTLVSGATADDVVSFQIFDAFNVDNTIRPNESSQTINGDLTITGSLTGGNISPGQWGKTAAGINTSINVGVGTTRPDSIARVNNTAILNAGIVTAYVYYGDVSNCSGAGGTDAVPGIATEGHSVFTTINVSGIATFGAAIDANSTSNFGDVVTISDTTSSTSTSTGALIVSGGVGIAKSLFVGEGISIAGTITYNDVTNVDSIGIVTARGGLNVGPLTGIAATIYSDGAAQFVGVVTASAFKGDGSGLSGVVSGVELEEAGSSTGITTTTVINFSGATVAASGAGATITIASGGLSTDSYAVPTAGLTTYLKLDSTQDHKLTSSGITTVTCWGGTEGDSHTLRIISSGISTVGFSTYFYWPSGSPPVLRDLADGSIQLVSFTVNRVGTAGTQLLSGASMNFS